MTTLIRKSGDAALIGKDLGHSYNELLTQINHLAFLLPEVTNQRVVIFSENRTEWITALYAVWKKGAIVVPVDVLLTRDEVSYILRDCTPRIIFCSAEKFDFIHLLHEGGDFPAFFALKLVNRHSLSNLNS